MGDRTHVVITIAKEDLAEVTRVLGHRYDPGDSDPVYNKTSVLLPDIVRATFYEVNYGGVEELETLAGDGVDFHAYAGAGGSYPPSLNVGWRGEYTYVTSDEYGVPLVRCSLEGPYEAEVKRSRQILATRELVNEKFGVGAARRIT